MTKKTKTPIHKVRFGNITLSIWENESKKDDKTFLSVTLQKSYLDGEEWKNTNNYAIQDLSKIACAIQEALRWIYLEHYPSKKE